MTDEKILMKELDEMVLKGHGKELMYACNIAAGAAIGGYQKAERMRYLQQRLSAQLRFYAQIKSRRKSKKIERAKTEIRRSPNKDSSFLLLSCRISYIIV